MSSDTASVAPQGQTATAISPPVGQGHGVEDSHSHGLSDKGYVKIALLLAVITAAEVAWSYLPVWKDATGVTHLAEVLGLLVMMAVKFFYVAANFMHLKFDDKILTRIFYFGLMLAVGVYVAALATFHVFY